MMWFSAVKTTVLAFAAVTLAQTPGFDVITSPGQYQTIPAGERFTVKWQPGDVTGKVALELLGGASPAVLFVLDTIAKGVDNQNSKVDWVVAQDLGTHEVYGIRISLESDPATFQYSFPFHIQQPSTTTPSATSRPTTTPSMTTQAPAVTTTTKSAATPTTTRDSCPAPRRRRRRQPQ